MWWFSPTRSARRSYNTLLETALKIGCKKKTRLERGRKGEWKDGFFDSVWTLTFLCLDNHHNLCPSSHEGRGGNVSCQSCESPHSSGSCAAVHGLSQKQTKRPPFTPDTPCITTTSSYLNLLPHLQLGAGPEELSHRFCGGEVEHRWLTVWIFLHSSHLR